jgi:hypothetical protein
MADVVYFFANGWLQSSTPDSRWLIRLFAIPPVGQLICYFIVFFKARTDKSVLTFYYFCLITNLVATLSYCWLWTLYTAQHYQQAYSYSALYVILFLLLPVGLMTYVIMWTPDKGVTHDYSGLREADIVNWKIFHEKLKKGVQTDGPNPYMKIMAHMHWAVPGKIMRAENHDDLKRVKAKLIAELNDIITDPEFYDEKDFYSGDSACHDIELGDEIKKLLGRKRRPLTDRESQRLNRLLIEACFREKVKASDGTDRVTDAISSSPPSRWHSVSVWWENFLANLKDGCGKAPFWAVVFFFTVFLAITYLFGFAFAFHDKHRTSSAQQSGGNTAVARVTPALYRPKWLRTAEDEQPEPTQSPIPTPMPPSATATGPTPYTFYFAPYSAVLNYKYGDFDESAPYTDSREKSDAWMARKNYEHFVQLVSDINNATDKGKNVRVRVLGGTDTEPAKQANYASNYELSEARARNVEYILMSKLSDKTRRGVEWFHLSQSTESPQPPLDEQEGKDSESSLVGGVKGRAGLASAPQESQTRSKLARLNSLRNNLNNNASLSPYRRYLDSRLTRIENLINGRSLSARESDELLNKMEGVLNAAGGQPKQTPQPDAKQSQSSNQKTELNDLAGWKELEEALNRAEVYASYVDASSRRRVVEVSLEPVEADPQAAPLTLKDFADSQDYSPLSLMDYMYFTICTITTTGYGDIIPTTPYAKYLCSLANILEVFFIVVFFNALLSVRGGRRDRVMRGV